MGALVVFDAARRDHFLQVRVGRVRGEGAVDAGWRFVDGDGVDVTPGKMSGPHFFIKPGGSVAMSSTTALHAIDE